MLALFRRTLFPLLLALGLACSPGLVLADTAQQANQGDGETGPPPLPPRDTPAQNDGPPALPRVDYYVELNGDSAGPFTRQQVQDKLDAQQIRGTTLAWKKGMEGWEPISTMEEFTLTATLVTPTPQPTLAVPTPQPTPAFNPDQYIVGTWGYTGPMQIPNVGQAQVDLTVSYAADKTLTGYGTISAQVQGYPMTATVTTQGTYTVQSMGPNRIMVTPNAQVTMSIPGQPPLPQQNTTPEMLEVLGPNQMRDSDGQVIQRRN